MGWVYLPDGCEDIALDLERALCKIQKLRKNRDRVLELLVKEYQSMLKLPNDTSKFHRSVELLNEVYNILVKDES